MAKLEILTFPDARLRTVAKAVDEFDDSLRQLSEDMIETMYQARGIGLAATQVNVHRRMLVLDVSDDQDQPMVLVNPEIVHQDGFQTYEEGCLSVPGIYAEVQRANQIRIKAQNVDGEGFEMDADGLLAICIQHEMDHLNGKLFVDYLSPLKRRRVRKRLEKQRRQDAVAASAAL